MTDKCGEKKPEIGPIKPKYTNLQIGLILVAIGVLPWIVGRMTESLPLIMMGMAIYGVGIGILAFDFFRR